MPVIDPTIEEMEARTARFAKLTPYQQHQQKISGLPPAILEKIAARKVFPVMVPHDYKGRHSEAPVRGEPGLVISISECPPGDGSGLHSHNQAIENFMCLSGRFRIDWGQKGEYSIVLEPLDLVSLPPMIFRRFTNISDETGRLLAIIHVQTSDQGDEIAYSPDIAREIESEHGKEALVALNKIGVRFDAGAQYK